MVKHQRFTLATDLQVCFGDPKSFWQRRSSENTNRFLRQYLPGGSALSKHTQVRSNKIAQQFNERPGKTLAYESPAERFEACAASTC